jgi:hypothetical protein
MRTRTPWIVVLLAALAPAALAQDAKARRAAERAAAAADLPWEDGVSIADYRRRVMAEVRGKAVAEAAAVSEERAQKIGEQQPGTVGAADGFGSRLGETLTNFLPLLGFAADAVNVSDDEKSVVVDFNPLRFGEHGALKLNATVTEPAPSSTLLEAVEESARQAQEKAVRAALGDFDDITWTLTYGYQRPVTAAATARGRHWFWGRHPSLYQPVVAELMGEVWSQGIGDAAPFPAELDEIFARHDLGASGLASMTRAQLAAALGAEDLEAVRRQIVAEAVREAAIEERLAALDLAKLGHLIDNQPQLVVTAAYRSRDELIGPAVLSGTLKVELGVNNLNSVLRDRRRNGRTLLAAYENAIANWDVLAKDRFTFSLSFLERDEHRVSFPYELVAVDAESGAETRFPRLATLDLGGANELHGKLEYSRAITRQPVEVEGEKVYPRVDFTSEYIDVSDDPTRQDRWVAEIALNVPLRGGLSLPLTVSWANHAELLGESDDQLGAHLGISYGLDRLFERKQGGDG